MLFFLAGLAFIGLAKAQSCPEPYGVQTYPNEQYCDKFYKVFKTYFTYFLTHANQSFDMYAQELFSIPINLAGLKLILKDLLE